MSFGRGQPKPPKQKRKNIYADELASIATRIADAKIKDAKAEVTATIVSVLQGLLLEFRDDTDARRAADEAQKARVLGDTIAALQKMDGQTFAIAKASYSPENPPPPLAPDPRIAELMDRLKLLEMGITGTQRPVKSVDAPATPPPATGAGGTPRPNQTGGEAAALLAKLQEIIQKSNAPGDNGQTGPAPAPTPQIAPAFKSVTAPARMAGATNSPGAKTKTKKPPEYKAPEWQDVLRAWVDSWREEHPEEAPDIGRCVSDLIESTGVFAVQTAAATFYGLGYTAYTRQRLASVCHGKMASMGLATGRAEGAMKEEIFWRDTSP